MGEARASRQVVYRGFTTAGELRHASFKAARGRLVAVINEMERCGSLLPFDIITRP
jgi:hypothetical protein